MLEDIIVINESSIKTIYKRGREMSIIFRKGIYFVLFESLIFNYCNFFYRFEILFTLVFFFYFFKFFINNVILVNIIAWEGKYFGKVLLKLS